MELRHLRYFVAVAESLSFTRAAERVHVTQSTLSHQIRQLEDEVGQVLFDRLGKKVFMTEAGQLFLAHAQRALREVDAGLALLRPEAGGLSGQLRIGATHTFNIGLIPECVALFLARHPTVKLCVEEMAADEIGVQLRAQALDLGIAYRPAADSDLAFEPLYNEELVFVAADTHPLAGRRRIRMVELHQQPLVLLPPRFATRQLLDECFAASGAEPAVTVEMSSVAPMIGLVLRMPIGTVVSANAVPSGLPRLRTVPIESPTPIRTPGLLWRSDAPRTAVLQAFAVIVRKTALQMQARPRGAEARVPA